MAGKGFLWKVDVYGGKFRAELAGCIHRSSRVVAWEDYMRALLSFRRIKFGFEHDFREIATY